MEEWKVIVSRKSGNGKADREWDRISRVLESKGVSCSVSFTERRYHAIELAREAIHQGYRKFLAIGGDGAVHEILNGVMSQDEVPSNEITLGIIPIGSGNDWPRLHRIPRNPEIAVDILKSGPTMLQDIVRLTSVSDGKTTVRYMINIGGMGFDSYVCYLYDEAKKKGHGGSTRYLKCLLKGFFGYKCRKFDIRVDGRPFFSGPALSVALGNGCYCGGGMRQTPGAECNDGLLDITVIPQKYKLALLRHIRKLYTGRILEVKGVTSARSAHRIEVSSDVPVFLEIDGESCGCTPVTAEIMPLAINVVTNM